MCVGHKVLIISRGCFASRWLVGDLKSFTSSTLHFITQIFVLSVCVNNLWISYVCLGGLWLFNSAWRIHACSYGRIYQSLVFHSRWRLSSCKEIVCYMHRVIDLGWVITMKKCSLANVLITGAAQKNFKILVCVFLIPKVLINSILANIHKQIREMFVGPELSPYWNKAPCVCKSGCNTHGSREV